MLETVAQAVVNGLLIGGIYALVSIGVTLIFGVVKIVNFAQGEFVMIGMYISFFLATYLRYRPSGVAGRFYAGPILRRRAIAAFPDPASSWARRHAANLSYLCFIFAAYESRPDAFTANYRTVHTWYSDEAFHLDGLYVPMAKLVAFVLAMTLSGILWVFLHGTDMGKAMRAAAQKPEVAMLMGINPNRVFAVATGVSLALAGAAGRYSCHFTGLRQRPARYSC